MNSHADWRVTPSSLPICSRLAPCDCASFIAIQRCALSRLTRSAFARSPSSAVTAGSAASAAVIAGRLEPAPLEVQLPDLEQLVHFHTCQDTLTACPRGRTSSPPGRRLPEVEEGTWFRTPCLRVRKKSFCRMKEDGETLVVRVVDLEDKEALLRSDPEVFFTTPHYDGYAYVLVRLARADPAMLAELIEDAWRLSAPKRVLAAYDAER